MRLGAGVLSLLLACVLGSCSGTENNVERGNREGVLYFGNGSEPQSIDPHVLSGSPEGNIADALFEPLVTRNPETLAIEPGVAERWELSDDGLSYTFYLNPEARWSNGDRVTAQDFHWSWQRALHPNMGNALANIFFVMDGAEAFHLGKTDDFGDVGVHVLDDNTLRVDLAYPNPFALYNFAYVYAAPVHRETVLAHGAMTDRFSAWTKTENFVGNGPFRLADWKLQRYLRVDQNPYYWGKDALGLQGIVYRPIESAATEEKMFRSGQLHAGTMMPKNKIPGYRAQVNTPLVEGPQMTTYYYMLNTKREPFKSADVRRAMALAIDRETLARTVLEDTVTPYGGYVPFGMPQYTPPPLPGYDPDTARALLASAGFPNGKNMPEITLVYNTSENHRSVAVALQQMWKANLNVEVTLVNQEWQVYLSMVREGNFHIARRGWNGDVTPGSFLDYMTSDSPINTSGFANDRYDHLVNVEAKSTDSVPEIMAIYREAERILLEEMPIVPVYSYKASRLVQPSVEGMPYAPVNGFNFRHVRLDPDARAWQWQDSET